MHVHPDGALDDRESDSNALEQPPEANGHQTAASEDSLTLEGCVECWGDAVDPVQRQAMRHRIAEELRGSLKGCARSELLQLGRRPGLPSAEEVVDEMEMELPTILAAYLRSTPRTGPKDFRSYVMSAVRNVTNDLVTRPERDRARLERRAESHPSRFGRMPTTPSQSAMRSERSQRLEAALSRLEARDREIVRRCGAGESFVVLGRQLGMPPETVRDHYNRGRAQVLRDLWRAFGGDPFSE